MSLRIESVEGNDIWAIHEGGMLNGMYEYLSFSEGEDPQKVVNLRSKLNDTRESLYQLGHRALGKRSTREDRVAYDQTLDNYGELVERWVNGRFDECE